MGRKRLQMKFFCFRSCIARLKAKIAQWKQEFRDYADKCLQSGYVPATYIGVQFITRQLARILVFIQLGRLRVIGKENLKHKGRFIFCPNHSAFFDAPVLYAIMKRRNLRYMTAFEEMRGMYGLKAVIMGAMGCFPVDRTKGKSVIEPAILMVVDGQSLVVFPEGKISATGECLPFKNGPGIIGQEALKRLPNGERIGMIPINILYHKRDNETAGKGFGASGFKWRGGVTVTIGKPIWFDEYVDKDPGEIMAVAHKFVCQAQHRAQQLGCPCD